LLLTRYRMCLSVVVLAHTRNFLSTRCSSLWPVANRWCLLVLLSPQSRLPSTKFVGRTLKCFFPSRQLRR
jgi:hypothetical protein